MGRATDTVVVLVYKGAEVARWTLELGERRDLSVVEGLTRLQLAARRAGCTIHLRSPRADVLELLELVGLRDLFLPGGLRQAVGEAEGGEETGVEEVVVADDPVA